MVRQTYRHTQTYGWTDRQTDRHTDRQADTHIHTLSVTVTISVAATITPNALWLARSEPSGLSASWKAQYGIKNNTNDDIIPSATL